jgi:hypothetical protein
MSRSRHDEAARSFAISVLRELRYLQNFVVSPLWSECNKRYDSSKPLTGGSLESLVENGEGYGTQPNLATV